jgi:hypothetical protein
MVTYRLSKKVKKFGREVFIYYPSSCEFVSALIHGAVSLVDSGSRTIISAPAKRRFRIIADDELCLRQIAASRYNLLGGENLMSSLNCSSLDRDNYPTSPFCIAKAQPQDSPFIYQVQIARDTPAPTLLWHYIFGRRTNTLT